MTKLALLVMFQFYLPILDNMGKIMLLYRMSIKNRVPYVEIQLKPWMKLLSSEWGLDVDGAPMVAARDQQKLQHTWLYKLLSITE